MVVRVRAKSRPGDCSQDRDLGPGHAERVPYKAMRLPLDEAIVYAATHGHTIRASR